MKKVAVVLFNLGGPDKPESVQPFLFNLFNDKAIIGAPQPIRWMIAKLISTRRAPVAQEIYEYLGGKSPLLELTQQQAEALESSLNGAIKGGQQADHSHELAKRQPIEASADAPGAIEYKVFISMRYWHPMSPQTVKLVKEWDADEAILLPLYPQFSTTTTGSSFKDWQAEAGRQGLNIPTARIGCYPDQKDFIASHVKLLKEMLNGPESRILFSAHGLPQKVVDAGDPYQWQVERTAEAIVKELAIENLDYTVCYQSKVGPLQWLEPSTEAEIERAGEEGKSLVIVPIAFVSEHSETLVELDIEYKELAEQAGVPDYKRASALGIQADYIKSLSMLCKNLRMNHTASHTGDRICPQHFNQCLCRDAF